MMRSSTGAGSHHARERDRHADVDPKVPALLGTSRTEWKRFRRAVESWFLSQTAEHDAQKLASIHKGLGPALYRNLLAAEIDVAALVEAQDPRTFAVEGGVEALLKLLETGRFSESKLRELPRILRHFYRGALRFRPGGEEPMRRFIAECRRAKAEMVAADSSCDIGDGAFCFWILEFSSLSEAEQTYLIGQCGQKYDLEQICTALINLFPNGSGGGGRIHPGSGSARAQDTRQRQHGPRRWARNAEADDDDLPGDDGASDDDDGVAGGYTAVEWETFVQEQVDAATDDAYYAGARDAGEDATTMAYAAVEDSFYDNDGGLDLACCYDDIDVALTHEDEGAAAAFITLQESRQKLNAIRSQRGFFNGTITLDSAAPSHGPSSSKGGKGKGSGKGKKFGCRSCGRSDCSGDCSQSQSRPSKGKARGRAAAGGFRPKGGSKGAPVGRGGFKRKLGMFAAAASYPWWLAEPRSFDSQVVDGVALAPIHYSGTTGIDNVDVVGSGWQTLYSDHDECCYEITDPEAGCFPALSCDGCAFLSQSDRAGYALVDSGASYGVAGVEWLQSLEAQLSERGLRPIIETVRQKFTGLGGHEQTAERRWRMPVGLFGSPAEVHFFEIPGHMHGLFGREDMARLETNLYVRDDKTWCDFEALDLFSKELPCFSNGHAAVDLLNFAQGALQDGDAYQEFRLDVVPTFLAVETPVEARSAVFLSEFAEVLDRDEWIATAVAEDRTWTLPSRVTKQMERMRTRHQVLFTVLEDNRQTFAWELFAGVAELTRVCTECGHRCGVPLDILRGVDLKKPQTGAAVKWMVAFFKPWLVAAGFPCTPYSAWQRVNRIQYGTDTDKLMELNEPLVNLSADCAEIQCRGGREALLENPWPAGGWDHHEKLIRLRRLDLMVLMVADQCQFDHVAGDGSDAYHRKTTGFMVPKGSSLESMLTLRCSDWYDPSHEHVQLRGSLTTKASRWPAGLCSTIMAACTRDLAVSSEVLAQVVAQFGVNRSGRSVDNARATRQIAEALYLRHEVLEVQELHGDKVDISSAATYCRRIVVTYNADRELAGYTDLLSAEQGYKSKTLPWVLRDTDITLVIWVLASEAMSFPALRPEFAMALSADTDIPVIDPAFDELMQWSDTEDDEPQQKRHRVDDGTHDIPEPPVVPVGGDLGAASHDLHDLSVEGREADGFGPKPKGVTVLQWGALKKLHRNMGHAPPSTLKRMLRRWGVVKRIIEAVDALQCSVCNQVKRHDYPGKSSHIHSTLFNENVFIDELEVQLSDGTSVLALMVLDDASSFRVVMPVSGKRTVTAERCKTAYTYGWLNWAGPPDTLHVDALKSHLADEFAGAVENTSTLLKVVPAESPHLKARIERAIDFFKEMFVKVNEDLSFTVDDDMDKAFAVISSTCNHHLRKNGFAPYQFVLGRFPKVPTSLTSTMEDGKLNLTSHSDVFLRPGAQRAEQIRGAAAKAFFELDTDEAARRALVSRSRRGLIPFAEGALVYFWRSAPTRRVSKRMQQAIGWRGPCIVIKQEGLSKIFLAYRGTPVLVTPGQLRHATSEELMAVENAEELDKLLVHGERPIRSQAVVDMREDVKPGGPDESRAPTDGHARTGRRGRPRKIDKDSVHVDSSQPPQQATPMDFPRSPAAPGAPDAFSPKPEWDVAPETPDVAFQPQPQWNVPPQSPTAAEFQQRPEWNVAPQSPLPSGTPRQVPQTWQNDPTVSHQEINASHDAADSAADPPRQQGSIDDLFESQGEATPDDGDTRGFLPGVDYFDLLANDRSPDEPMDSPISRMPNLSSTTAAPQSFSPGWAQPPDPKHRKADVALALKAMIAEAKQDRTRYAFLAKRVGQTATRLSKKGREIRLAGLPEDVKKKWHSSDLDEWRKWLTHDAVYLPDKKELATISKDDAIPMRIVRSDKNEATRGELSLDEHPIKAKSRIVSQGFKDKQALTGKIDTDAPTLSTEGTAMIYQTAASENWRLEQGDVDSAFLSGGYLDPKRKLYFVVPRGGLPAIPELGWPALPEGTILGAKKGSYGMKDAPLLWFLTHTGVMTELGMIRSRLNKAYFLHYDSAGDLDGLIGVHVDDDLITGTKNFFETVIHELRHRFNFGKWHTCNKPGEEFVHCGRRVTRGADGSVHLDMQSYIESVLPIALDAKRKAQVNEKVTHFERQQLWSKVPQLAWVMRGVNPYISFRVATLQQRAHDVDLTVESLKDYNSILADARRKPPVHVFHPVPLRDAVVIAVGDASLGNVGKTKTRSQGGSVTMIGEAHMATEGAEGKVSVVHWRSHRIKRVVRSTIASETFAALEAVEEADLYRSHLAEMFHYGGRLDLKNWESQVDAVVPMVHVTDARSLYDLIRKRGTVPTERRLLLDIESLRERVENGMIERWCDTKQMVADCLTKHDDKCGDYLRYVIAKGRFSLTKLEHIESLLKQVRTDVWDRRKAFYEAKYPNRARSNKTDLLPELADLDLNADGWLSIQGGASLHMATSASTLKLPPSEVKPRRAHLYH